MLAYSAFFGGTVRASTAYQVVDLGALSLTGESGASAINATGQAAGWSRNPRGDVRAVRSDASGGLAELAGGSRAFGINGAGDTVGIRFDVWGNPEAVLWHADGTVTFLGSSAYAMAVNDNGQVLGQQNGRAVAWSGGVAVDLNVSASWSTAAAVNQAGAAAGTAQFDSGAFRAFSTASGTPAFLPTLGGGSSYGQAINSTAWVAGGSTVPLGYLHAFLYYGGAMLDLGTLGGNNSSAYGVNDAGIVVGYSEAADGESSAFLWNRGSLVDLNSLIAEDSGWRLTEASAINNAGQIVGRGILGGIERAFRLDPSMPQVQTLSTAAFNLQVPDNLIENPVPEPGSWVLVLIGTAGVLFGTAARRRRSEETTEEDEENEAA